MGQRHRAARARHGSSISTQRYPTFSCFSPLPAIPVFVYLTLACRPPAAPSRIRRSTIAMKFAFVQVVAFAATVSCRSIDYHRRHRHTPLHVSLTPVGNTAVKARVTNTASEGFNLLCKLRRLMSIRQLRLTPTDKGTFLDEAPVDKLVVTSAGKYENGLQGCPKC